MAAKEVLVKRRLEEIQGNGKDRELSVVLESM
jgi:hypothetical protein